MSKYIESLPNELLNSNLPDPALVNFYHNIEDRILWLDCDVDDVFLEYGKFIIQFNREDKGIPAEQRKPIKLLFFSHGGDLDINNAMIDVIKASVTPVYGYNMGIAESAGCFIFMSCHKRYAMPNSSFLIHKGSGMFGGSHDEVVAQVLEYQRKIDELSKYILDHSTIPAETLDELLSTEWFVTAKEAHEEYGFVDAIITSLDEVV